MSDALAMEQRHGVASGICWGHTPGRSLARVGCDPCAGIPVRTPKLGGSARASQTTRQKNQVQGACRQKGRGVEYG